MDLAQLLKPICQVPPAMAGIPVADLFLDSRQVRPGGAFVAVRGGAHHGAEFAGQAAAAGAAAILADPAELEPGWQDAAPAPWVAVPGLAQRLVELAQRFYTRVADVEAIVGVTGTNGKTSVVNLLAQALELLGRACGVLGTLGIGRLGHLRDSGLTTADLFANYRAIDDLVNNGAGHIVLEASSHALDQGRLAGLGITHGVFTNLTRDHLDYHGDMERYAAAKQILLEWSGLRQAIVNIDDPWGAGWAHATQGPVLTYGAEEAADLRITKAKPTGKGLKCVFETPWGEIACKSPLLGLFNASNLAAVVAVLGDLEFTPQQIAAVLPRLSSVQGRMNRLTRPGAPLVVVDYAHTPDSLEQALKALRPHCRGRLICVFGCGGDRDRGKRPLMGRVAEQFADRIVLTDDNPRTEDAQQIIDEIAVGMLTPSVAVVERDRRAAIALGIEFGGPGDIVLVAGKGHENYQEVASQRHDFSDLDVARELLEARA